ncbi:MAG: hypothetical protein AABZ32_07050, partial [Bacteroidota bacterium]
MKKKTIIIAAVLTFNFQLSTFNSFAQSIGINSTGTSPDPSALLDCDVSAMGATAKKGLLIPRVSLISSTDAVTIPNPATSLLIYNSIGGGLSPAGYYYNSGTTVAPVWVRLDACSQQIPTVQYPTFDAASPYLLLGALW